MAKKKEEITEIVEEQTPLTAVEGKITKPLYKYEVMRCSQWKIML